MTAMSDFQRSALALGLLVLAAAALILGGILPIVTGFGQRQSEREMLLATIRRNERVTDTLPVYARLAAQQRKTAEQFAFVAPTASDATERMRQRLMKLVAETGANLVNAEEVEGSATSIKLRADLKLSYEQLYEILSRLQIEEPHVTIRYLSVTADRALESGHLDQMDARVDLSAEWRVGEARDAGLDSLDSGGFAGGSLDPASGDSRGN